VSGRAVDEDLLVGGVKGEAAGGQAIGVGHGSSLKWRRRYYCFPGLDARRQP
jgi:hypothetical protein